MWPFSKNPNRVDGIIKLMKHRPTEWSYTKRSKDYGNWSHRAEHKKSGVSIQLSYYRQENTEPHNIQFWHTGSLSSITGREKSLLKKALQQLQFDRIDSLATKHLKLDNLIKCCDCGNKIIGWAWVCKCQSALDQGCYGKDNVCPDCGGSLVGGFIDEAKDER